MQRTGFKTHNTPLELLPWLLSQAFAQGGATLPTNWHGVHKLEAKGTIG
ncbi:MAG: hypothetical protein SVZ03_13255 [Spirochaetota bacterium]|nr:hypothetical protein [Spirochaetota bacterium]